MARRDSDRNLLFGIMALLNDFITRDALIAAMTAWTQEKHRPIGDILIDRGDLEAIDRDAIDVMIDRRLAKLGGDPARSLAALSSTAGVVDDLRRVVDDPDLLASIAQIPTESQLDPHATRAPETVDYTPVGLRYRKVRDHAIGGLGIVYVAHDEELSREVALKEIKPEYAHNPASQSRFVLEAEITGGLEHPGIVPVYGLGHHDDGRPFYAMRFIRGDSLKHAIAAFHADEALKRDPGARTLALQKLLRRFLDVCNAIAFAHSRGVLHRDLKPDNVMVGKYGETLVVDWGLAKAVGRSGADGYGPLPESTLLQPSSRSSAETLPGSVIGTPAYMSPEQATGRLDLLGPASDVYSLGATLYTLLTGQVSFTGTDHADVLRKVERGEFPRPREASPWLDPALEAICLKAMALRPDDRYASPKALAEDVERWLADEPVTAHREPLVRRARRWARKHRTALATAASATTVAALLLGAVAGVRIAERRKTDAAALATLGQADGLAIEARTSGDLARWDKAVAEALRAQERLESGGGSPALHREAITRLEALRDEQSRRREILDAETKDSQVVAELDEARLQGANQKDDSFDFRPRLDAYQAAFRAYGIDVASLPVEDAAKRIRSSKVADALIAALDDWALYQSTKIPSERLKALIRDAETDPVRGAIRDAIARGDTAGLRQRIERPEDRDQLGPQLRTVFKALVRLDPEASLPLLETVRGEHPSDFWINLELGMAYLESKPPQVQEGVRCLTVAVALRPKSPGAHNNLGAALKDQGKLDQAIESYRKAIQIKPDFAGAHSNLGTALQAQGKLDLAIAAHRKAIEIKPDYAPAYNNLGTALDDQGKIDLAVESYRKAIQIQPDFAVAHNNLGANLKEQGKLDLAVESYRKAIQFKPDYARAHSNLGVALKDQGKLDLAVESYRKAIQFKPDYALAHNNLGGALASQRKLDLAVESYRKAIEIQPDYAEARFNLGVALKDQGKLDLAVESYRKAIEIQPNFAEAHSNLGAVLRVQGKLDLAVESFRKAIEFKPDYAEAHSNLGVALQEQGKLDLALESFRKAIEIKPDYVPGHFNLGVALEAQGKLDLAVESYRKAIEIKPDYADAHHNLGGVLYRQGKVDLAVESCRGAIEIQPDFAEAHNTLGSALAAQGKLDLAVESFRKAIQLQPDYANAHNNLGKALQLQGKLDQAVEPYRKAIQLQPDLAKASCDLGLLFGTLGRFREALEYLERGHAIGSRQPGWKYPSQAWVQRHRRFFELDNKLPAILKGETKPVDAAERLDLATVCQRKGLHAASARFADEAFAEKPALASNPQTSSRYNAACSASLAGSGQGKDDPMPDEAARAKLREQSLGWLRADLAIWAKILDGGNEPARKQAVLQTLAHWKEDADLAGIRDEAGLAKLPEAEREAFHSLWTDVEALRIKAGGGK
jgi:eukaryotic-like serine/threonine-protein kinase